MLDWLRRSWFRHPASLRPDAGRIRIYYSKVQHGEISVGIYWRFDKGWHARRRRFLGVKAVIGQHRYHFGLKDSN